ncbi:MAG TPA: YegP family protein [Thermoanaerobaculia bacterium]|nr:YegP family protein [Thermoanaerobaculia bacterium]
MAAAFVIEQGKTGKFRFNLRAGNNEVILTSETYDAKAGAENGIESVRKNSQDDARYVRKTAKNGESYFVLTAANGQTIGKSEMYKTTSGVTNGIKSVKKNAPDAKVVDKTE